MKKTMNKKTILATLLLITLLFGGCGSSKSDTATDNYSLKSAASAQSNDSYAGDEAGESYDAAVADGEEMAADGDETADANASNNENATSNAPKKISTEMLVYRGSLVLDTLDFEKTVADFKKLILDNGGFVESENYADNKEMYGRYYQNNDDTNKTYSATVRIPSDKYEYAMTQTGTYGDLRTKSSNVTNVTQQYSTYKSELEIYEAEYARYLDLLAKAKDDKYALEIEKQLFDLQVKIADLKSNMSNLETDVAYSYIDVEICEVKEYKEEPAKKDTFIDRLKNTCEESLEGLLGFLEGLLFFIIRSWYGFAFFALIVWIIVKIIKALIKRDKKKKEERKSKTETSADDVNDVDESDDVEVDESDETLLCKDDEE